MDIFFTLNHICTFCIVQIDFKNTDCKNGLWCMSVFNPYIFLFTRYFKNILVLGEGNEVNCSDPPLDGSESNIKPVCRWDVYLTHSPPPLSVSEAATCHSSRKRMCFFFLLNSCTTFCSRWWWPSQSEIFWPVFSPARITCRARGRKSQIVSLRPRYVLNVQCSVSDPHWSACF